jgi:plastocyanin
MSDGRWIAVLPASLFAGLAVSVYAGAAHVVVQNGRAFVPGEIAIARGDTLSFSNQDEFIHQIFVDNENLKFDSAEQPPGETIGITFSKPGTYEVRCHIHPKMRLSVTVK